MAVPVALAGSAGSAVPALLVSTRSTRLWQVARPGDLVVCLGAGNITNWAYALPGALQKIADDRGGLRPVANDRENAG